MKSNGYKDTKFYIFNDINQFLPERYRVNKAHRVKESLWVGIRTEGVGITTEIQVLGKRKGVQFCCSIVFQNVYLKKHKPLTLDELLSNDRRGILT